MKISKTNVQLKQVLLKRRKALLATLLGELGKMTDESDRPVGDQLDSALDSEYSEACTQLAEAESRELENIEHALQRFRQGEYGLCEECSGKIPVARLRALPYVSRCVKCQSHVDRRGSLEGLGGRNRLDFFSSDEREEVESTSRTR